ncbi:hypothetical protein ORIO_17395 [Cereibacter azotoformans]|uniref:Uncharacterized protein n=2 Tax=Cereibacter TaxID=1653176 RepID=A0A2T5KA04_9RHOB|nr:hypothetical protein [Cereibacter azotoformans]AXQ95330.1 hypothetical protein D0Z66_15960 [Cereibacter sphaeroides]PTR19238.1 hypothetical protein C8J28_10579 [Cereibacter azotoformans]UIJ32445.1 hypothetical protein LV780_19280 [Cereibacter azotoformans]ULB11643.1 hypothetical protein ORIO_17395 [Cereibacter azotoformans]
MIPEPTERRRALFRSRRGSIAHDVERPAGQPDAMAESGCVWKSAGLCPGQHQVDANGRMVCLCAQVLMAPSPDRVIDTLTDLGLSDEQIGRYFHIPVSCVTALRRPT